jgi:hypothetical protein
MKTKLCTALSLLLALMLLFTACGQRDKGHEKTDEGDLILVTRIDLLNKDLTLRDDGTYYTEIEADADGVWRYQISYCTAPENANDRGVNFVLLTAKKDVEIDERTATVKIQSVGFVGIMLQGKDGSDATATLYIRAK